MIMYVRRNTSDHEFDVKGALAMMAKGAFWSRGGIPIFFTQEEIDFSDDYKDHAERPTPGMIGRSMRDDKTYVVAADGEVYQIESPWPTLQAHATAVSKLAELERRHLGLVKDKSGDHVPRIRKHMRAKTAEKFVRALGLDPRDIGL